MPRQSISFSTIANRKLRDTVYHKSGDIKGDLTVTGSINSNIINVNDINLDTINGTNESLGGYHHMIKNRVNMPYIDNPLIDVTNKAGKNQDGTFITNNKWRGGTIGLNGKLYFTPYNATNILEVNSLNNSVTNIPINYSNIFLEGKWNGAVCSFNNKIYFSPFNADKILVLNLDNKTTYTLDYTPSGRDPSGNPVLDISNATSQYWGACLDNNDNVIFIPFNALQFMKLNPETDNITYYGFEDISNNCFYKVGSDLIPTSLLGSGGALASNGNIYCGSRLGNNNANKNLFLAYTNPSNETVDFIDISGFNFGGSISEGIVTGLDKRYVHLVPHEMGPYGNLRNLKYIDTSSNTLLVVPSPSGLSQSYSSYSGGVLTPDGKIYCFSFVGRNTILAIDSIDPSNNSIAIPNPDANTLKMYGGLLGPNGYIYTCPFRSNYIQVITPLQHISEGYMISPYYNKS